MTAHADMLVNGSFENGPAIPLASPVLAVPAGNSALSGWTVASGTVSIVTDNYWVPISGHRSVCLSDMLTPGSTVPGSIRQTFASAPGAVYRLSFWMAGEGLSLPTIKHLRVNAGATTQDFTFDVTPSWNWDMFWTAHTLDFTAAGTSTTVQMSSLDASNRGPAVDSLRIDLVSAGVPAPTSEAVAFAGVTPDPVRTNGRVAFSLATAGPVRLAIYDVQGRRQALLADGMFGAGTHTLDFSPPAWGARPGIYLAVLHAAQRTLVRRFTVLQ
jgi:choice-of-anchor C domain-containing protein